MRTMQSTAAFLFALAASPLGAQVTVSSLPVGASTSTTGPRTYAESFRTPDATNVLLTQFRFFVGAGAVDVPFAARVFAFNTATSTPGTLLSEQLFAAAPLSTSAFTEVLTTFNYNLLLTPGADYLFALSYSAPFTVAIRTSLASEGTQYAGGAGYESSSVTAGALQSNGSVTLRSASFGTLQDFAFTATFQPVAVSTVPEPGTWALLATGLVLIGGVAARRKRTV